jgi:hypothetical protein
MEMNFNCIFGHVFALDTRTETFIIILCSKPICEKMLGRWSPFLLGCQRNKPTSSILMIIFLKGLIVGRSRLATWYNLFALLAIYLFFLMGCGGGGGGSSGGGSSTGNGGIIKIGWDPNTESDLAGYRVYYGTRSDDAFITLIDVGMATREAGLDVYTITNLNKGQEYCIALTAYSTSNYESDFSNLWGDVCGNAV